MYSSCGRAEINRSYLHFTIQNYHIYIHVLIIFSKCIPLFQGIYWLVLQQNVDIFYMISTVSENEILTPIIPTSLLMSFQYVQYFDPSCSWIYQSKLFGCLAQTSFTWFLGLWGILGVSIAHNLGYCYVHGRKCANETDVISWNQEINLSRPWINKCSLFNSTSCDELWFFFCLIIKVPNNYDEFYQ